jgi:hypothetical protein
VPTEKAHVALPQLYGAPAYSTPRTAAVRTTLPLGPDDLPMENYRSADDQVLALQLMVRPGAVQTAPSRADSERGSRGDASSGHRGRPLLLRALTGRLGRPAGH